MENGAMKETVEMTHKKITIPKISLIEKNG